MDVDSDVDTQLLQQFSSMGTQDKEVLIAEFQKLLGDQINAAGCAFFLDMNNWNLQAAICSYYDFEQPTVNVHVPSMKLVRDITIGEGESVPPNTRFVKTWRIRNAGVDIWPPGCCLKFTDGHQFGHQDRVMVEGLQPGAETDVSIEMWSPVETGMFQGQWRMTTATGLCFGEFIWVILHVEESGLLGVTQQLSKMGGDLSHPIPALPGQLLPVDNPFGSPFKFGMDASHSPGEGSFGSPAVSTIAQDGSAPSSPCVDSLHCHPRCPEAPQSTAHVRTVLFPTPDSSPGDVQLPSHQDNHSPSPLRDADEDMS